MTVVGCPAMLFAGSVSMPSVGTLASTTKVPCVLVCTSASRVRTLPPAIGGSVQLTMFGPAAGTGAQPVIGLPGFVPVKVNVPGMLSSSVFGGEVLDARSSFSTVIL